MTHDYTQLDAMAIDKLMKTDLLIHSRVHEPNLHRRQNPKSVFKYPLDHFYFTVHLYCVFYLVSTELSDYSLDLWRT